MTHSMSTPNGHVVRFEIPGFGVTKFRPEVFGRLFAEKEYEDVDSIIGEIMDMGFELNLFHEREMAKELALIEWIAIYGECHGYGS